MDKLCITMFLGPMGQHDHDRAAARIARWMQQSGAFHLTQVGDFRGSVCGVSEYMKDRAAVTAADAFFFLCPEEQWEDPADRLALERAVAGGTGAFFFHGVHPSYYTWEAAERMIGLLWRETASHGDYDEHEVRMEPMDHPITRGVTGFATKEELYCSLTDPWGVQRSVLASAWSDPQRISRHGQPGTGCWEPVLTTGSYGAGRTVNFLLGHVWTHYTGHGLFENTMLSFEPPQFKTLLLRACEWAATGQVQHTIDV